MTRKDKHRMRVGFTGDNRTIEVELPAGDIAPWDLDTRHTLVGSDVSRIDGVAKVTGRARYAYDVNPPGLLQGALLRSPHARAVLKSLRLEAAEAMPGVAAVLPTKQPGERLRFVGDDVVAIAAETLDQARDALEKVEVEYEIEDHNTDYLAADGAPKRDADGEVLDPWPAGDDDQQRQNAAQVDAALAAAAVSRTATYSTEVQTHSSLETHGLVAHYHADDDSLEVWASTQGTFGVRAGLAGAVNIPANRIRVHAEFVGGGFGSKLQPGAEVRWAAELSRATRQPVKLMLDRYEEHTCAGNRPAALMQIRAGVDKDGTITAWDYRSWGGPGHIAQAGSRAGRTSGGHYYLSKAARRNTQLDLHSDTDAARAMRAPGFPQGTFATELMVDELAAALGVDPLTIRLRNDEHLLRRHEWQHGAELFGWHRRRNATPGAAANGDARRLRGAGMASAFWFQMGGRGSRVTCRIHPDGTVESRNGAQDIGTGMKTVMATITAEELQIPIGAVRVAMGDTQDPPGPASGGSTTTPTLAPAVRHAAALAGAELAAKVAAHLKIEAAVFAGGKIGDPAGKMLPFTEACKLIGPTPIEAVGERFANYDGYMDNAVCGVQFAEVEVDTATGSVRVLHMTAVQDCGLVIARKLAESQVLGAMIQGISYALHEQRIIDHRAGRMLNGDFLNYKITGPGDMPTMQVEMLSVANGKNNVGAAGLGEPPIMAASAAIANAVYNAIGVPVRSLPITPARVLRALEQRGGK